MVQKSDVDGDDDDDDRWATFEDGGEDSVCEVVVL